MSDIHPTAIVDPRSELAADVVVGPYVIVGADVRVGASCRIGAHAADTGPSSPPMLAGSRGAEYPDSELVPIAYPSRARTATLRF